MKKGNSIRKIWIDIENTPHVIIFNPIVRSLKDKGYEVVITARNYGGIENLLKMFGHEYTIIGKEYGSSPFKKISGVISRTLDLYRFIKGKGILASLSHGSRSHIGASRLAGIPSLTSYDYEYSSKAFVHILVSKVILPVALKSYADSSIRQKSKVSFYHGYKEEIYLGDHEPHPENIIKSLNIDDSKVIVFIRPPAMNSHYYTEKSKDVFTYLIKKLEQLENILAIFSPRTGAQKEMLREMTASISGSMILEREVNGIDMLLASDIVFSGGGTMNREAALLDIPVFSIFGGKTGAVDKELLQKGKLKFVESKSDLDNIKFSKREKSNLVLSKLKNSNVKEEIIESLLSLIGE